jgi:hypothetical protein
MGVAPVLVKPGVEGAEGMVQRVDIVLQELLHPHTEGGEEDGSLHALRIHHREARLAILIRGRQGLQRTEGFADVAVVGATPVVVVEASRARDRVEGRVRDEALHLATHQQALLAPNPGPLHATRGHLRVGVAGEGIPRLVVVVVGVAEREVESRHGRGLHIS